MKNAKRILAWIAIILLLSIYIITFIVAFIKPAVKNGLLMACLFTAITLPCLLYAFILIYRVLKSSRSNNSSSENDLKSEKEKQESE